MLENLCCFEETLLTVLTGVGNAPREGSIDDAYPTTKEEFNTLKSNLVKKLQSLSTRSGYNEFVEEFVKDICISCKLFTVWFLFECEFTFFRFYSGT